MKTLALSFALIAVACLPSRAHHEGAYGLIWKAGFAAPKSGSPSPSEVWRYAFISKYTWVGCQTAFSR